MSDLINRQDAIDALSNGALINYQATGSNNGLVKAIDVIKGLPSAEPRWIPCSERLPEIGEGVLGCSKGGTVDVVWRTMFSNPPGAWDTNGLIPIEELLAWMPLPEPWKGEDNEAD